jgi:hypothetical protein
MCPHHLYRLRSPHECRVTREDPVERELWWQLRVELLEMTPTVWWRFIVPETITLPRLRVLQARMGSTNIHLHEFVINGAVSASLIRLGRIWR